MREYGVVAPTFWTGETGKKIVKAGPECVIIALHLMSCPHANAFGHYYLPIVLISHETGIPFEGASKGLQRVCETGFCEYDDKTEVVWVFEMARYQIAKELKEKDKRVKWVNSQYQLLPKSPFLFDLYNKYKDSFRLTNPRGNPSPFDGASKPHRSQEQEQEQEQDIDKSPANSARIQNFSEAAPPSVISPEIENKSKHFREHVGTVLHELILVCKTFQKLPAKEKAFNPYQLLQDAVNNEMHPGAILEVFRDMIANWAEVKDPWPWFKSICKTRSKNYYEKEKQWEATDYKETIADLAKLDLFKALGLKVKTI